MAITVALAVACFCMASSAVYLVNDVLSEDNRIHPQARGRWRLENWAYAQRSSRPLFSPWRRWPAHCCWTPSSASCWRATSS